MIGYVSFGSLTVCDLQLPKFAHSGSFVDLHMCVHTLDLPCSFGQEQTRVRNSSVLQFGSDNVSFQAVVGLNAVFL